MPVSDKSNQVAMKFLFIALFVLIMNRQIERDLPIFL